MPKSRRITLAAINIAMHAPHPSERYVELLQKAFRRRMIVRMGALHGVLLGTLYRPEQQGREILVSGELYRFVKLDPGQPWFNVEKKEPATEQDVESINIPGHLLHTCSGFHSSSMHAGTSSGTCLVIKRTPLPQPLPCAFSRLSFSPRRWHTISRRSVSPLFPRRRLSTRFSISLASST